MVTRQFFFPAVPLRIGGEGFTRVFGASSGPGRTGWRVGERVTKNVFTMKIRRFIRTHADSRGWCVLLRHYHGAHANAPFTVFCGRVVAPALTGFCGRVVALAAAAAAPVCSSLCISLQSSAERLATSPLLCNGTSPLFYNRYDEVRCTCK